MPRPAVGRHSNLLKNPRSKTSRVETSAGTSPYIETTGGVTLAHRRGPLRIGGLNRELKAGCLDRLLPRLKLYRGVWYCKSNDAREDCECSQCTGISR